MRPNSSEIGQWWIDSVIQQIEAADSERVTGKKAFSEEDKRENFLQTPPLDGGSEIVKRWTLALDTSVGTELFRLKHFANG